MPRTTRKAVTLPTIHLNGSGAARLRDLSREAFDAIDAAASIAASAAPHARDYYTQGDDIYGKARAEWAAHMAALEAAAEFFAAHALHASDRAA